MQERGRQRGKVREGPHEGSNVYAPASGLTGSEQLPIRKGPGFRLSSARTCLVLSKPLSPLSSNPVS